MTIDPNVKYLYRLHDFRYASPLNEYDELIGNGRASYRIDRFRVSKVTPQGYWAMVHGHPRWIKMTATKRFACPTIEEAVESFLARKRRQRTILNSQLSHVEEVTKLVKKDYPNEN